ncbi:MAG: ABC transporter permease [Clostridiales bacterium]|nr:ABC transporter permease [Clostridiales bacterium]MDY5514781.1 ABC transporter permease [Candidatus Ventricola sp.]
MRKQADVTARRRKEGQFTQVLRRLSKNTSAMIGLVLILLLILTAVFAPWITPYDYTKMDIKAKYAGSSLQHLFGCDELGRDIFSRCIYGARASLSLGLLASLVSTLVGVVLGSLVGYFGGWVDTVIMRLLDILQAIPGMLLSIAISAALGSGFGNTIIALSIGGIPMTVRLLRGSILTVRKQEYIEAAEKINCSKFRVITAHILPNSIAPLIVSVTMGIGNTILQAASLSYIGLGVQPPTPEWGAMLSAGKGVVMKYPHLCLFPGLCIMIVVLSFNMLGDGLRDAMDPKLKN